MKIEVLTRIVELSYEKNNSFYYKIEYDVEKKLLSLYSNRFINASTPFQFVNSDLLASVEKKRKFLCLLVEMIGKPESFVNIKNQDTYLPETYRFQKKPESLLEIFEKMTPLLWKVREYNLPITFTMEYKNSQNKYLDISRKYPNIKTLEKDKKFETLKILDASWTIDESESIDMYTVVLNSALDFLIEELIECLENNN